MSSFTEVGEPTGAELQPVKSLANQFVTFTSGDRYDYEAVPPEVVDGLRVASSKGRFFSARIRDRFAFERHPRPD